MPANTILTSYQDEVGRLATVTIDIGTDPGDDNYGPAVLVNDIPAQMAKINSTSGAWRLAYGAPQPVTFAALLHSNLDAGLDVVLQASAGGSPWTTDFEAPFVIPTWYAAGTTRKWPIQPWIDLTTQSGYNPSGYANYRLYVRGTNSENLQVGGLKLYSDHLRLTYDFREGLARTTRKPTITHRTAWQIATRYSRLTAIWSAEGNLLIPTSQLDELDAHFFENDGEAQPFVIVPNGLRNRCYFVTRSDGVQRDVVRFYREDLDEEWCEYPLSVVEVGRGVRPGGAVA